MRITINDIARISGFSKTSVSFAFNDPSRISDATRQKILRIADELGYVPDPAARNLSTKKMGTIGFLLPQTIAKVLENPYMNQVIIGIGEVCHNHEYSLTMVPPLRGNIDDGVRTAAVDGFITLGLQPEMKVVQLIRRRHVPFVTMDGRPDDEIPSVNIDDEAAGYEAMRYVLSQGHRRIALVTLEHAVDPDDQLYPGVGDLRRRGHERALGEAGLDPAGDVSHVFAEASLEGGRQAVRALFAGERGHWPTAVVCLADVVAIGAMEELRRMGLEVPRDVSLVGFDDIPEATMVQPALTTVRQPGREKGIRAARMLFDLMADLPFEPHATYPHTLCIRDSVAAPSKAFF